jgi:hypothetical protein
MMRKYSEENAASRMMASVKLPMARGLCTTPMNLPKEMPRRAMDEHRRTVSCAARPALARKLAAIQMMSKRSMQRIPRTKSSSERITALEKSLF